MPDPNILGDWPVVENSNQNVSFDWLRASGVLWHFVNTGWKRFWLSFWSKWPLAAECLAL